MEIKSISFVKSSTSSESCPKPNLPEYAMIGRSNVGKSSLINYILQAKNTAKTSGTPGKTKLINHFFINEHWYLVDLPGYGFAKLGKTEREKIDLIIKEYILKRKNLMCLFILIDSRLSPQKKDLEFIHWVGINKIAFSLVFTKIDKLTKNQVQKNTELFKKELLNQWEELPEIFLTSSEKKIGGEKILKMIAGLNKNWK